MLSTSLEFRRNGIEEDLTYRPYQINGMNAFWHSRMAFSGTKGPCSCFWVLTFSKSQYQKTLKTTTYLINSWRALKARFQN
ncbi:MAG: hypothetical protein OXI67_15655, partial [Candidatus Poribacteria bacterium]|nr:hypothetical protein [Candidatus Poribacteria bacterium]